MTRLQRGLGSVFALLRLVLLKKEIAVVLVRVLEERAFQRRRIGAGLAAVGRVGHVPVGPFEPARVVGPKITLGRADAGADVAFRPHDLHHVVGLAAQADHREIVEHRRRDDDFHLGLLGLAAAAEPASLGLVFADGVIVGLLLLQGRQVGRVAPVRLGREPPRRWLADRLAFFVPGIEVIAVRQLEGEHLRRLADLAGQLQQAARQCGCCRSR